MTTHNGEQLNTVRQLLATGDKTRLEEFFAKLRSWDAAHLVSRLLRKEQKQLFALLRAPEAADMMEHLPAPQAAEVISEMSPEQASPIVDKMDSNEGADLLQNLTVDKKDAILKGMDPQERSEVMELLSFPENSAGGLMMKEFIVFEENRTAGDVIREMRSRLSDFSRFRVSYVYVVNRQSQLQGVLPLRDLMLSAEDRPVRELMRHDPFTVPAEMSRDDVARVFEQYHFLALPVVDKDGRILGIISQDDALKIIDDKAGQDFLKFSGILGGEESRDMPFFPRAGRRLAWLSINILLNLVAASVVWAHEDTLTAVIGIAMFLPIISDMSGCSGNQSIAVSIRELAKGKILPGDFLKVWWAEASVGLFNGCVLGLELALIAFFWKRSVALALIVGAALWINTLLSVTFGSLIPLALKKSGKDPALASSPILTTLTDLCGFYLVLSLAAKFIQDIPH